MTVGSLFAGIGGFDLGLERAGFTIKWQVEIDPWCQRVLAKHWPRVKRYGDIKTIDWGTIEPVDLLCGGFPCQPFSLAGKQRGKADDRYLWPEVVRCLDALRPTWFLGENVPGLINLALDQVCADLESLGYAVWPVCVPACAVDAPHIRQRVWIVGYAAGAARERGAGGFSTAETRISGEGREDGHLSVGSSDASQGGGKGAMDAASLEQRDRWMHWTCGWEREPQETLLDARGRGREEAWMSIPESLLGRVAHGVPSRVDRLRGLGNAVVPQLVEQIGRMIMEAA